MRVPSYVTEVIIPGTRTTSLSRATEADATDLLAWLCREMLPQDPDEADVQDYALAQYRDRRIEPSPPYCLTPSGCANSGDLKTVLAMCMKARAGSTPI